MKNLIPKIFIVLTAVVSIVAVGFYNSAFAAGAYFNTDSQDKPTLRTGNYSKNGPSCTTCWTGSVMADAGDIVSFDVYYHNTSADTATQTRVKANIPTGNFGSFTVTADLYAANATAITGSALVSLSSTQNLTFIPGSVNWYPNQSATPVPLLYGQSGNEIITTGLNIGDVSASWTTQGHVTFRVQVSGGQQQQQNQAPTAITNTATSISQNAAIFNASVNPNSSNTTAWFEYGTTQSLGTTIGSQTIGNGNSSINISYTENNLLSNTVYYYRAVASNQYGTSYGSILNFTTSQTSGSIPSVITNSVTSVSSNSANFNSSVNPNNYSTNSWFEYGTTQSLGYTIGTQSIGSGNASINITYPVSGLLTNTVYYYRAVASNQYGTSYGSILNFTTLSSGGLIPTATTGSASSINQNSATLNISANPNNSNTTVWFEYGTTQSLGYSAGSQSIGSGNTFVNTTGYISSLLSNTVYYYRAVASNQYGTSYGSILSFTTSSQSSQGSAPTITTNSATTFLSNSIMLNGTVNANGVVTAAWFEYGATASLGQITNSQSMGAGTASYNYSYILSNLVPNATYYYRAAANNAYGANYGSILTFVAPSTSAQTSVSTPVATAAITTSNANVAEQQIIPSIVLISNIDKTEATIGDEINYTAVYKNISSENISNAKLTIALPQGIEYQSANIEPSSQASGNIAFNIGKIYSSGQGSISIKAKIANSAEVGNTILKAKMDYADAGGNNKFAETSSTIVIKNGKSIGLTASLLDSMGSFLGSWAFNLILLSMVVGLGVYIVRYIKQ